MKIIRNVSASNPSKCNMSVKGFFGNLKGEVVYVVDGPSSPGYAVLISSKLIGGATDFYQACDMLLTELKIIKTNFI